MCAGCIIWSGSQQFSSQNASCYHPLNTSHGIFPPFPDRTAGQRYLIDCEGCGAWGLCENCNLTGDTRVPVCAVVLDHSTSPAATGTLEELELEPGYWRATNTSKIVRPCYNGYACVGGAAVTEYCSEGYEGPCERSCVRWCSWSATQEGATCGVFPGWRATYNDARRCQAGRREFLTQTAAASDILVPGCTPFVPFQQPDCAVCEEGYAPGLSFSCSSCSDEGNRALRVFVAAVIVVLVVAVGIAVLVDLTTVRAKPGRKDCCAAGFRRLQGSIRFQSLKIAVVTWQIITQVTCSNDRSIPPQVRLGVSEGLHAGRLWLMPALSDKEWNQSKNGTMSDRGSSEGFTVAVFRVHA